MKKCLLKWKQKYPILFILMVSILLGMASVLSFCIYLLLSGSFLKASALIEIIMLVFLWGPAVGLFFILPVILTFLESRRLWQTIRQKEDRWPSKEKMRWVDLLTMLLGILYSYIFLSFLASVMFESDWQVVLYNRQKHTPIFTQTWPTLLAVIIIAFAGYCMLAFIPLSKMPPLALVLAMAAMYLGTMLSLLWMVQIFKGENLPELYLLLLPLNCLFITARTVLEKVRQWNEIQKDSEKPVKTCSVPILKYCDTLLIKSERWPIAAFFLMWPLLGVLIGILVLFGQEPNAIVKAWTETADWNLSNRVAPQNLYMDEHYLCTVAAGGHSSIVKPLRLGVRHGHEVIVNRQLCVANAFEQILEEKTPKFHRAVRDFYDTYGYPIGRWIIKSKIAADLTYFMMKPLEWLFVLVLYLVDINPESRIAIQYTGKTLKELFLL